VPSPARRPEGGCVERARLEPPHRSTGRPDLEPWRSGDPRCPRGLLGLQGGVTDRGRRTLAHHPLGVQARHLLGNRGHHAFVEPARVLLTLIRVQQFDDEPEALLASSCERRGEAGRRVLSHEGQPPEDDPQLSFLHVFAHARPSALPR
jgi:hypothetical protein